MVTLSWLWIFSWIKFFWHTCLNRAVSRALFGHTSATEMLDSFIQMIHCDPGFVLPHGNRISKHYYFGKIGYNSLVFALVVMIKVSLKKKKIVFYTVLNNYLYLLLREFTQIPVLPVGNKYWQLCGSGLNAWLKNSWKPIIGGLKVVYQKKN